MRRTGLIFLVVAAAMLISLLGGAPAGAHPEVRPLEGRVGQRATFRLLVDGSAPNEVTITAPPTFRLDDATAAAPWSRTVDGGRYRFTSAAAVTSPVFELTGTPTKSGVTVFTVVTVTPAGETIIHDASCTDPLAPYKGALLFVDVELATACEPPSAERPKLETVGLGLVGAAIVLGAGYPLVKRARERSAAR